MVVRIQFYSPPSDPLEIPVEELELLGFGGQGQIYTWKYQGKDYVVKVILNDDSVFRRLREIRQAVEEATRKMGQKVPESILERAFPVAQGVGVDPKEFGFDKNDKAFLAVYNWIEGVTLDKYLEEEPPLSPKRKAVARQTLEILSCLEKAGIINNDLYPDNFIVNPLGRVYIIDMEGAGLLNLEKRTWEWEPVVLKKSYAGYCEPPEYSSKADEQKMFSYRWIGTILLFDILFGNPYRFLRIIDLSSLLDLYQKADKENIAWPPYGSEKVQTNYLNPILDPNTFRNSIREKCHIKNGRCSPLEKLAFFSFIYGFEKPAQRPSFSFMQILLNEVVNT
jgi:serine/threonine protein kinase